MTDRVYSFLGLAKKAGAVVSGEDACQMAIKKKKAHLIIIAEDASDNTKKRFISNCEYRSIEVRLFGNKELLGRFAGKNIRSVIAVLHKGFAKRLMEMIDNQNIKYGGGQIGKN